MIAPVKTAIVGCGVISDAYLSTMRKRFKILDVVGCCDINPHRAQERARAHGIRALTMDDIRADDTLELVVNLTTPTAHYPVTRQLLDNVDSVYLLNIQMAPSFLFNRTVYIPPGHVPDINKLETLYRPYHKK